MARDRHAAALLGLVSSNVGVQVLVELVAVHLAQKLGLAQLVQGLQVSLCLWRRGQLTQVAVVVVVEPVVDLGESRAAVVRPRDQSSTARLGHVGNVTDVTPTVELGLSVFGVVRWRRTPHVRVILVVDVVWTRDRGRARDGRASRSRVVRGGYVLMIHGVQRGHLGGRGQAVGVRVKAAVGAGRVSEASHAGEDGAGAGNPDAHAREAALVFVERVTKAPLVREGVLIRGQSTQEEAGVHPLANAFQLLLPARSVLVVGVVLHVLHPQPLRFLHIGPLLRGRQGLPGLS